MNKVTTAANAVSKIKDGSSLMIGGFYGIGTPHCIIDEIVFQKKKNLTLITIEGGSPGFGIGKLLENGCVSKLIVSWVGNIKNEVTRMQEEGKLKIELNPQGTLVERVRSGGYGLGGILTPTGLGTYIEEAGIGKRITLDGRDWLYHTALKADFALVEAYKSDEMGNLIFRGTQTNANNSMCMAADVVIASVLCPVCKVGDLPTNQIHIPGNLVDMIVQGDTAQRECAE